MATEDALSAVVRLLSKDRELLGTKQDPIYYCSATISNSKKLRKNIDIQDPKNGRNRQPFLKAYRLLFKEVKNYYYKRMKALISELEKEMDKRGCSSKLDYNYIKVVGPMLSMLLCLEEFKDPIESSDTFGKLSNIKQLSLIMCSMLFSSSLL